jgi:predicted regulator of amino acid metabolism with ACT domain
MLIVRNDDTPGMIAKVASELAGAGINISDMSVGKSAEGKSAMQVLITTEPVPSSVVEAIRDATGIDSAAAVATD